MLWLLNSAGFDPKPSFRRYGKRNNADPDNELLFLWQPEFGELRANAVKNPWRKYHRILETLNRYIRMGG